MNTEKKEILEAVNTLPNDATFDDAIYVLYMHSCLKKSQEDLKNGRVITMQELKQHIDALEVEYANNNL